MGKILLTEDPRWRGVGRRLALVSPDGEVVDLESFQWRHSDVALYQGGTDLARLTQAPLGVPVTASRRGVCAPGYHLAPVYDVAIHFTGVTVTGLRWPECRDRAEATARLRADATARGAVVVVQRFQSEIIVEVASVATV